MLIGFATNRWKWNEWGKHPNICLNALIHVVMSCDILAIQNISWPFDLRERIFELWQFDRRTRLNKTQFFSLPYCACNFPSPLLNNEAELSRWRFGLNKMIRLLLHISLRGKIWGWNCIVNSSIELRLFNWKRPVELRKIFGLDFIYNVIHGRTVYMISVPFTRISNFFFNGKRIALS